MQIELKDYVLSPLHECASSTNSRCDICFGELPDGKTIAVLTLNGPLNITPERREELVFWLRTLTRIVEHNTDYPAVEKTFTFYEGNTP